MLERAKAVVVVVAGVLAVASSARGGDLDPTFGNGGVVGTDIGGFDFVTDVLLQPDGDVPVRRQHRLERHAGTRSSCATTPTARSTQGSARLAFVIPARSHRSPSCAWRSSPTGRSCSRPEATTLPRDCSSSASSRTARPTPPSARAGAALIPSMIVASIAGIGVGADGRILVGARLSGFAGEAVGIARFAADGSADATLWRRRSPDRGGGATLGSPSPSPWIPTVVSSSAASPSSSPARFFTDAVLARFDADGVPRSRLRNGRPRVHPAAEQRNRDPGGGAPVRRQDRRRRPSVRAPPSTRAVGC